MAYGKVVTGFSKPYVANYANNEGVVSYSNPTRLARGVEVSIEPEVSDASNFYADNIVAETVVPTAMRPWVFLTLPHKQKPRLWEWHSSLKKGSRPAANCSAKKEFTLNRLQ